MHARWVRLQYRFLNSCFNRLRSRLFSSLKGIRITVRMYIFMLLFGCHWCKLNLTWRMGGDCRGITEPPFHCHTVGRWWGQSAPCRDKRSPVGLLILRLYVHVMFHQLSLWEQQVAWCLHRTESPHFLPHRCILIFAGKKGRLMLMLHFHWGWLLWVLRMCI